MDIENLKMIKAIHMTLTNFMLKQRKTQSIFTNVRIKTKFIFFQILYINKIEV